LINKAHLKYAFRRLLFADPRWQKHDCPRRRLFLCKNGGYP